MDPNWFLSAIAQSGAAISGILGGFVTTRFLLTMSEHRNLASQNDELSGLFEATIHDRTEMIRELVRHEYSDFVQDDTVREALSYLDKAEQEALLNPIKNLHETVTTGNQVLNTFKNNRDSLHRILNTAKSLYKHFPSDPKDWDEFFCKYNLDSMDTSSKKIVTGKMNALSRSEKKESIRPFIDELVGRSNLKMPHIRPPVDQQETLGIKEKIDDINREISNIALRKKVMEDRIATLPSIGYLLNGLKPLIYFTIIGVVTPLSLMLIIVAFPLFALNDLFVLLLIIELVLFVHGLYGIVQFLVAESKNGFCPKSSKTAE